jgi:TPR repeat protein
MRAFYILMSVGLFACASANDATPPTTISTHGHGSGTHQTTTHTPGDPEEQAAHEKDCNAGKMAGCHAAALDHYYSPASPEHDTAAVAFFRKGCDGGYAPSCNGLGVMYAEGRGVTKDEVAAVKLFRSSCAADATTGCEHYASALESGRGVAKDPTLAELARARGRCVFEASLHPDDAAVCAMLPPL